MFGYSNNHTELIVLDFESSDNIMASSTSSFNPNKFPGVPEETLSEFVIKQEGVINVEDDDDENFSEEIFVNKVFLTKNRTLPNSMRNVYPMKYPEK